MAKGGKKENKEAAWQSLKWLTSTKEGAESQQKHIGWISGIKDNSEMEPKAAMDYLTKYMEAMIA